MSKSSFNLKLQHDSWIRENFHMKWLLSFDIQRLLNQCIFFKCSPRINSRSIFEYRLRKRSSSEHYAWNAEQQIDHTDYDQELHAKISQTCLQIWLPENVASFMLLTLKKTIQSNYNRENKTTNIWFDNRESQSSIEYADWYECWRCSWL